MKKLYFTFILVANDWYYNTFFVCNNRFNNGLVTEKKTLIQTILSAIPINLCIFQIYYLIMTWAGVRVQGTKGVPSCLGA